MFMIRDGSGKVYNEVKRPTAVYDSNCSVLLKIGEWDKMVNFFDHIQTVYRSHGFHDMANDICLMELPNNQEEIDKVFQICDYIGQLHKRALN